MIPSPPAVSRPASEMSAARVSQLRALYARYDDAAARHIVELCDTIALQRSEHAALGNSVNRLLDLALSRPAPEKP